MTSDTASTLALLTVQAHREHTLRLDFESNLITSDNLALWDREAGLATNGNGC
jgi:hypothetical protein